MRLNRFLHCIIILMTSSSSIHTECNFLSFFHNKFSHMTQTLSNVEIISNSLVYVMQCWKEWRKLSWFERKFLFFRLHPFSALKAHCAAAATLAIINQKCEIYSSLKYWGGVPETSLFLAQTSAIHPFNIPIKLSLAHENEIRIFPATYRHSSSI